MMNRNEKLEIAKRLRFNTESELSRDDLDQILEDELAKPEEEMDTEFIQQVLELLEEAPAQEQQHAAWQKVNKELRRKRWLPAVTLLTRIAAVGVILVALLFATYGTAQALNWEFLLRLMKPFAETFMVYSGKDPDPTPVPQVSEVYSDAQLPFTQTEFATLADCPDQIDGYPVKPVWMPERFTYLQGSMYSDTQIASVTHIYQGADGFCVIDVSILDDANHIDSYQFEQQPAENSSVYAAGYQVTFYRNSDNELVTASWMQENAHYTITGSISEEDITKIIESMMK